MGAPGAPIRPRRSLRTHRLVAAPFHLRHRKIRLSSPLVRERFGRKLKDAKAGMKQRTARRQLANDCTGRSVSLCRSHVARRCGRL